MPRIRLTLAYQGTRYAGWQLQPSSGGRLPTIQGAVEKAITIITGTRLPVHASGRTDAGVHAEAQTCHFDLPTDSGRVDWVKALNAKLPDDIRVIGAFRVDSSFHSRKNAIRKCYGYSLWAAPQKAVPRVQAFVWSTPPLDYSRMMAAVPAFLGTRDFASFQNAGTPQESTVRTVFSINKVDHQVGPLLCPGDWPVCTFFFEGDGFLKQMVRNMMGFLVWVGLEKISPENLPDLLASKDRKAVSSPTAPAQGLTLMRVDYPDEAHASAAKSQEES